MIERLLDSQGIPERTYDPNAPCWSWVAGLYKRSKNARIRRRRIRLWQKDNRCRLCREQTILPEMMSLMLNVPLAKISNEMHNRWRDRLATIDHVYSRFSPHRKQRGWLSQDDESRTRLLCWKCNNNLSKIECSVLALEEQRRRSGYFCRVCQSTYLATKLSPIVEQRQHVKTVCLACGAILIDRIQILKCRT